MKYFSLKIVIICLIVTPILYVATLTWFEKSLNERYTERIQNLLIGDSASLLDGSVTLEERIAANIETFLQHDKMISLFKLKYNVQVAAQDGRILYPLFQGIDALEKIYKNQFDKSTVAQSNFELLNQDLKTTVTLNLSHGSRFGNFLFFIYFGISSTIFIVFYLIGRKKAEEMMSEFEKKGKTYEEELEHLNAERSGLFKNINKLNEKYEESKKKAKVNEDELFDEIISLEAQIKSFVELKRSKDDEISQLKSQVRKFERRKSAKTKRNEYEFLNKRFNILYKNLKMHRKAITGFINLNDDQQIKAEELIHQLDAEPENVIIKRKVFVGKKHKAPSFEVLFAYNGRLYFRKIQNNQAEVLVIGTKNSQQKDMEFLHSL